MMGGKSQGAQTPTVHGVRVSSSIYGTVPPIVCGRARVPTNVIWLGDQTATLHKGGGKGMGGNSSSGSYYTYTVSWLSLVALGPIVGVARRYTSDSGGLRRFPPTWVAANFNISMRGIIGQAPWPHLVSKHPGQDLGYTGSALVAALNWQLGQSPMLPQESFEVFGFLPFSANNRDSNAADVVVFMTTDAILGMQPLAGPTWNPTLAGTTVDNGATWTNFGAIGKWTSGAKSLNAIITDSNFNAQVVTTAGTAGGTVPRWNQSIGGTTTDGSVIWTNYGPPTIWLRGFSYALHACVYDTLGTVQVCTTAGRSDISGWLDLGSGSSIDDYRNFITAYNFFISPTFDQQKPGKEWLALILEMTFSDCYWSEGELRVVPYATSPATNNGVTWTPNLTPVMDFTTDDYVVDSSSGGDKENSLTVTISDPVDRHNSVKVEFIDISTDYNINTAEQIDDNDIILSGKRVGSPRSYHPITNGGMANDVAKLWLADELFITRQYVWKVPNTRGALLDPMDVVSLTSAYLGLAAYPVRIVAINETGDDSGNSSSDFSLEITAEDLSPDSTPGYLPPQPPGPQAPTDAFNTPGSVNTPMIYEPPMVLGSPFLFWFLTSGADANYDWGGCNIWMSIDGGSSYDLITTIRNPGLTGQLLSSLASHADPDTVNTLAVDLTESGGILEAISHAAADGGLNLALIDGELVTFADVATTATPFQYNLTYLRRGYFGTTISSHSAGASFFYLGSADIVPQFIASFAYSAALIGTTVHFKFTSFNDLMGAEEDLSTVADYTYMPDGPALINSSAIVGGGWSPSSPITIGFLNIVHPGFGPSGFIIEALNSGTTGLVIPTWPGRFGQTVMDGTVRWINKGPYGN